MQIIRLWMAERHGDSLRPDLTTPEDLATAAGEDWLHPQLDGSHYEAADEALLELARSVLATDLTFDRANARPATKERT